MTCMPLRDEGLVLISLSLCACVFVCPGSSGVAYLIGGLVGGSLFLLLALCVTCLLLGACIRSRKKNKQVYRHRQRFSCKREWVL